MIKRNMAKRLFALVGFVVMITLNALANILPINGVNTGEVSDAYFNLFAPATITFAIWGLIYLLLGAYSLYQLKIVHDLSVRQNLMDDISIVYGVSSFLNAAWIVAWHYELFLLSVVLIALVLVCLMIINNEIRYGSLHGWDFILIKAPFGIYFGWITVATIANITTWLVSVNFNGFGLSNSVWTLIILGVSLLIGITTMLTYKNLFYGAVLLWSYAGILLKHLVTLNQEYLLVVVGSATSFAIMLVAWSGFALYTLNHRKH
jgi:hypothetical protein